MTKRPKKIKEEQIGLDEELSQADIASELADTVDPDILVRSKIPSDIFERYEIFSYRNAATILRETRPLEFEDLLRALREFSITTTIIRTAGGNESRIPKLISNNLRPNGWYETVVQGDLVVTKSWRGPLGTYSRGKQKGQPRLGVLSTNLTRKKYLDGHKIDYVKGRVAFDLEWNSKDQTFDRDLYAFNAFFQTGVIDVGVLLTRSGSLKSCL
jgi:hypothetical protein